MQATKTNIFNGPALCGTICPLTVSKKFNLWSMISQGVHPKIWICSMTTDQLLQECPILLLEGHCPAEFSFNLH